MKQRLLPLLACATRREMLPGYGILLLAILLFALLPRPKPDTDLPHSTTFAQRLGFSSYQETPLIDAIRSNNIQAVENRLAAGADVNLTDAEGVTPLYAAIQSGQGASEMVDLLLAYHANPNATDWDGSTPLTHAIQSQQWKVVKALVDHGANPNLRAPNSDSPLLQLVPYSQIASDSSQTYHEAVQTLLDHGADPNVKGTQGSTPLQQAILENDMPLAQLLVAHGGRCKELDSCFDRTEALSASDRNAFLKTLLDAGVKPDNLTVETAPSDTPLLLYAVQQIGNGTQDYQQVCDLLLQYGANPDIADSDGTTPLIAAAFDSTHRCDAIARSLIACKPISKRLDIRDKQGNTALRCFCDRHRGEFVKLLLERGADPNIADKDGDTPLIAMAAQGQTALMKQLLRAHADLERKDKYGYTALMFAVWMGKTEGVKMLLAAGADVQARDKQGYTCLMRTQWNGRNDIAALLRAAGEKQ